MPPYQWLVFDADGTLFDFRSGEKVALMETTRSHDLSYSAEIHQTYAGISAGLWRKFENGEISSEELRIARFKDLFDELGIDLDPVQFNLSFMRALGQQTQLLPGAEDLVKRLSTKHRLLLATNGIAIVQRSRFSQSSIRGFFEDVVISDEIGVAKPQVAFMVEAFSRMGNPSKSEVLMIGDSLSSDIAGGAAFGIDTCWFNPNGLELNGFPEPTFTIKDLAEIDGIVGCMPDARSPGCRDRGAPTTN